MRPLNFFQNFSKKGLIPPLKNNLQGCETEIIVIELLKDSGAWLPNRDLLHSVIKNFVDLIMDHFDETLLIV